MMSTILQIGFLCWVFCVCVSEAGTINIINEEDLLPNCNGVCTGRWSTWTNWGNCKGGDCHLKLGKQSRQRDCHVHDSYDREWITECRQKEEKECADVKTCTGNWAVWGAWTQCVSRNGTCQKSRRRICLDDTNQRVSTPYCLGGLSRDTSSKPCGNESCLIPEPKMSPNQGIEVNQSVPVQQEIQAQGISSDKKPEKGLDHHAVLIIAVAVGSLVFGAVFVLLLINVVRRKGNTRDGDDRGSRWKRIGSTNTSSTGYAASYATASDVMSMRSEFIDIRSPSGMTLGSGNSQPQFFGRNDTLITQDSTNALLGVNGSTDEERPRQSRLLQENVYWEINAMPNNNDAEFPAENPENDNHEVVQNVLYGSRT